MIGQVVIQRQADLIDDILSNRFMPLVPASVISTVAAIVEWNWDEATQISSQIYSVGALSQLPLTRDYLRLLAEGKSTRGSG